MAKPESGDPELCTLGLGPGPQVWGRGSLHSRARGEDSGTGFHSRRPARTPGSGLGNLGRNLVIPTRFWRWVVLELMGTAFVPISKRNHGIGKY